MRKVNQKNVCKMLLKIERVSENDKQTLSKFEIIDSLENVLMRGDILEPPDRDNQIGISRINEGEYDCVKRFSEKYGDHFHLLNVPGRTWILIHVGNYNTDTRGCLLPGEGLMDIDGDGLKDVTSSGDTMRMLNEILPNEFTVVIRNNFL